jgi:hypothetical protein
MDQGIQLQKRVEQVGILLAKRSINQAPTVRVGAVFDVSGSARKFYAPGGVMQETVNRLVAVAMKFDDNGELDVWSFASDVEQLESITPKNYSTYVQKEIVGNGGNNLWGATEYAPPIQSVVDFYFGDSKPAQSSGGFLKKLFGGADAPAPTTDNTPAYIMFITDGANSDQRAAEAALKAAAGKNIYWMMIGVGRPDEFRFLEKMADDLPNVGFVNLASLEIPDEKLYEELVCDEFCQWVKKF